MKIRNLRLFVLFLVVNGITVYSGESPEILWNGSAESQILERNELVKLGNLLPEWKIKQMTWPSKEEINADGVVVGNELKLSCKKWLEKFICKDYLPEDLEKYLVAMKNWGLISKESEQKRLCDVFIARFKKDHYITHIQESPYNVVITVADERFAKEERADQKNLVIETARLILNEIFWPDPNSEDLHVSELVHNEHKISKVVWLAKSVKTTDEKGKTCGDPVIAQKIGASAVRAKTNGKLVTFEIVKRVEGKRPSPDPYVERFSPVPVEQEEKPKKPRFVPPVLDPGGFGPMPGKYDPNSAPPPKKNP